MRKILVVVPFCLLMNACKKTVTVTDTVTVVETIDLKRGLIAYYPFNGNANDTSGNNKNGTLMNGTTFTTDVRNKSNGAAYFDGSNDYINVTDANSYFSVPKMSIAFQVNFRNTTRSAVLSKTAFDSPSGVSWGVDLTNQKLSFTVPNPSTNCGTWVDNGTYHLYSNLNFQTNTWYHVTLIYNQGVELMYINGQLNSAKVNTFSTLGQCSASNLKIGGWWQNDIVSIAGKLDELRFYNRILGENEIEKLASEIN